MGLGKILMTINASLHDNSGNLGFNLVMATLSCVEQWRQETQKPFKEIGSTHTMYYFSF